MPLNSVHVTEFYFTIFYPMLFVTAFNDYCVMYLQLCCRYWNMPRYYKVLRMLHYLKVSITWLIHFVLWHALLGLPFLVGDLELVISSGRFRIV